MAMGGINYSKYFIQRADGKPITFAFVLEIQDPLARLAMAYYAGLARHKGNDKLANDLARILDEYHMEHPDA